MSGESTYVGYTRLKPITSTLMPHSDGGAMDFSSKLVSLLSLPIAAQLSYLINHFHGVCE